MRRAVGGMLGVAVTVAAALAGCASPAPEGAAVPAGPSASPAVSSVACPITEPGVELPAECIPYDPELMREVNGRYADRRELDAEAFADAEARRRGLETVLAALGGAGAVTPDAVREAISAAGFEHPQVQGADGNVAFGVAAPLGGCLFGGVRDGDVTVEVGGGIMDGGCLPAVGH